jgi:UDP-glucose:(heptosyl)LPS alpha-1,3-glucosyltransferase
MAVAVEQKWNIHFNRRRKRMATVERALLTGGRPPITIALSEYVKRTIRQHYDLPEDRLATLFNAVDLERFAPTPPSGVLHRRLKDPIPVALMIANDFERKGLPEALSAMWRLGKETPAFAIIGKEDFRSYRRLPPPFTPIIAVGRQSDPRPFYADADFFLLPTKHDPCSLVVLEALAMGLPVISTVFNGATEIMKDGVHGYVLKDPADVDALADAMRKMLDPERRAAMREACLALRPQLSYEHHLDALLKLYDRAIALRHKR